MIDVKCFRFARLLLTLKWIRLETIDLYCKNKDIRYIDIEQQLPNDLVTTLDDALYEVNNFLAFSFFLSFSFSHLFLFIGHVTVF